MRILSYLKVGHKREVDGTQFYRQVNPLRALSKLPDFDVMCITQADINDILYDGSPADVDDVLRGYDIYAYPRMVHNECEVFLDAIHANGGQLVIDADDDLTEDYKLVSGRGELYKETLGLVDYVTCSTQALADRLAQYTTFPPYVCENYVDVDWMQSVIGERMIEGVTMGFSGSPTHWGDWYIAAVPFSKVCAAHPEVTPVLHGQAPAYLRFASGSIVNVEGTPYITYPAALAQFDVLLCAVDASDPFNAGKSGVKALEAMAVGAVAVCSNFDAYAKLADQGAPIVIVEEPTRECWQDTLENVLSSDIAATQEDGRRWVREHRDISTGVTQWAGVYDAINRSNPYAHG